jgi:hypothetical protein
MRKPFLHVILFAALCLLCASSATQAQTAYGYSEVGYDSNARYVYGYSATWTDYYAAWYYDPEVHALLLKLPESEIPLAEGHDIGYSDPGNGYQIAAEVNNESGAYTARTTYEEYSTHILRPYYSYSYCFDCWYDPYGFSMWGNSFEGPGSYNYGWPSYFYNPGYYVSGRPQVFGRLSVTITTPADQCTGGMYFDEGAKMCMNPTPTPTPPQQCPSGSVAIFDGKGNTITDLKPNAMPGATVEMTAEAHGLGAGTYTWEFTDLPAQTHSGDGDTDDEADVLWKDAAEKQVKVTFKPNSNTSCSYPGKTTVNVVFPTVTELFGDQHATRVINTGGTTCLDENGQPIPQPNFGVGCFPSGRPVTVADFGIVFTGTVKAPDGYISRPAESQVRWLQRVNLYYKGQFTCGDRLQTLRSTQADLSNKSWMLDTTDPYGDSTYHNTPAQFADNKSTLEFYTNDSPVLQIFSGQLGLVSDTRFEMHLVYTGVTSAGKQVEKSLGFIPWKIPGTVTQSGSSYALTAGSAEPAGNKPGTLKVDDLVYQPFQSLSYTPCPTTNPTTLPAPKKSNDIGSVLIEGSAGYDSGTYTVSGSGNDIWDAADAFQYVNETLTGDGDIVARVASVDYTDAWAKAGVMIRETLDYNSRHASMYVTPGVGTAFQWRTDPGAGTGHVGYSGAPPSWVKLTRRGSTFTGYTSSDGVNWVYVGSATVYMGNTVYVGLAVTSHNSGLSCRATFDNVNITPVGSSCDTTAESNCYDAGGDWNPATCHCTLPPPDPCLRKPWLCDGGPYGY